METIRLSYFDVIPSPEGILHARRNSQEYPSLDAVQVGYEELFSVLDDYRLKNVSRPALLYDVSAAPRANNDLDFEGVHIRNRTALLGRVVAAAVLVASAVGQIQMRRLGHTPASRFPVFNDEAEARRYLRSVSSTL
ncbi:MAG: hypothetical protein AAFU77_17835 [Myxococcota bacterium]